MPTVAMSMYAMKYGRVIGAFSCGRTVYKCKYGKYVYKVNKFDDYISVGNEKEYEAYLILSKRELPSNVRLPEMRLLSNGILVMPYIAGRHPKNDCDSLRHAKNCPSIGQCWYSQLKHLKINDLHNENVIIDRAGKINIIDLDCGVDS